MRRGIDRRIFLGGLGALLATPAMARPPFRLKNDPQPLLSPPILDEAGTTRHLDDFAGRVILLNIWATWCPPCREEMPSLERLEATLGGDAFLVLPLCIDADGIGRGRRFYDEIGINRLPLFWAEPMRVQLALAFIGLPTTLLIDPEGREMGRLQGPFDWSGESAFAQISEVLRR